MAEKDIRMKKIFHILALFFVASVSFAGDYIVMDDETETFLCEIVNAIKRGMGYEREIKVYISTDQTLNASAIQSGDIVVNAGAIIQSSNYKELITILAHEVGHIEGGHIPILMSHMKDFMKAGLVPALIGGAISAIAGNAAPLMAGVFAGQSISQGMVLGKMRQKEEIADTKAADALKKLGWYLFDGCLDMHKKLASKSFVHNEYLSSHPHSSKRIEKYKQYYEEFKNRPLSEKVKKLMKKYEAKFEMIKKKLQALVIQNEFLSELYKSPKNNNEKYARAVALYRLHMYSEAIKLIDDLPSDDIEQSAYYNEIKCMALINLKKNKEAAELAKKLLQSTRSIKDHRDLIIIYAEAVSSGNIRSHAESAIKYLRRILAPKDDDISALHELGKLYTITNRPGKASYCAAQTAFLSGDNKMAKIHASRAIAGSDPTITKKANDILKSLEDETKK